jgi:type II secretory pathway pseudopilin PulG
MKIKKLLKQNNKGFTLIELIIYFTLLSVILLIITDLFFRISEASLESTSKSRVEVEGEYVLNRITYDIHRIDESQGDLVQSPANPGDSSPSLLMKINGKNYIYESFGQEIVFGESGVITDRLTSNSVEAPTLTFTHFANPGGKPTIKINFTLESTTPKKTGVESKNFETVVSVR